MGERFFQNRFFALFVAFALLLPAAARAQTISLDTAVQDGVSYLTARFPRNTRLAVSAIGGENPEVGAYAMRQLETALVNSRWFTVVERNEAALSAVSREIQHQMSGDVSDETSAFIGKQLGAEVIVSGAFVREGQNWRLDLKALRVESAEVPGQWSARNIRPDPSWAALASSRRVFLAFDGDELSRRDKQNLTTALREAFKKSRLELELDESAVTGAEAAGSGYGFTVSLYTTALPAAPPANTALLQGEFSIDFTNNGRVLLSSVPYNLTETNMPMLLRRVAEKLRDDEAFFRKVGEAIK